MNTTAASNDWKAVHSLSELAAASYPDVLIASYNIMMVGTASTVWKNHPDFVSFDRSGSAVVDTPGERLSLDLASAEAREWYRSNILATVNNMQLPGVYLDYGVLAFGTPNWRAARVAYSSDYTAFEASISAGLQGWQPQHGFLITNSPGNPLADGKYASNLPGHERSCIYGPFFF